MKCAFDGCDSDFYCKGFCAKHYYRNRRHGLLPCPICKIEGCEKPAYRRALCNTHALREDRHGDPNVRKKSANGECRESPCSVDGCDAQGRRMISGVVYCMKHGTRVVRHGDPNTVRKLGNGDATPERKKATAARAMKAYSQTPHGKMRSRFNVAKSRVLAGIAKGVGTITKEQFLTLFNSTHCHICGQLMGDDRTIDHVTPLARGGTNELDNLRMAHLKCNQRKSDK